jgi:hypothetical protein
MYGWVLPQRIFQISKVSGDPAAVQPGWAVGWLAGRGHKKEHQRELLLQGPSNIMHTWSGINTNEEVGVWHGAAFSLFCLWYYESWTVSAVVPLTWGALLS